MVNDDANVAPGSLQYFNIAISWEKSTKHGKLNSGSTKPYSPCQRGIRRKRGALDQSQLAQHR